MNKVERWIRAEIKDAQEDKGLWGVYTNGKMVERFVVNHWSFEQVHKKELQDGGYWLVAYVQDGKVFVADAYKKG